MVAIYYRQKGGIIESLSGSGASQQTGQIGVADAPFLLDSGAFGYPAGQTEQPGQLASQASTGGLAPPGPERIRSNFELCSDNSRPVPKKNSAG